MVEHWYKLLKKISKEKENLQKEDRINIKMNLTETDYECINRRI
jgi:hypothetical protein